MTKPDRKDNWVVIKKTGSFLLGYQKKIKGRKYCPACSTDVTVIRSHDCIDGRLGLSDGLNVITINHFTRTI